MPRVALVTIPSYPSLAVDTADRSPVNEARRQRMLRELGCTYPHVDSVNRASDRTARILRLLTRSHRQNAYEELKAQLEIERRLCADAIKLAEAIKKSWEEAEAKTRIEIELRVQAERKAREEAEAKLEFERKARGEAERMAEKMFDTARSAHAEEITRALAEMMARVQAEQQEIAERRARAASEDPANDETVALVSRKRGVLHKVFFYPRNRLPH